MRLTPSAEEVDQVFLPLSMSGFGLRRSFHLCHAAYLTAKLNFCFNGAPVLQLPDGFWQQAFSDLRSTISGFQPTAPPSTAQALQWMSSADTAANTHADFCSLKWWSLQINNHTYNMLLDRSSARDRALIRCLTDRHANSWLQPCSTENLGLRLIPAEYTVLSKLHLGVPLFPSDSVVVVVVNRCFLIQTSAASTAQALWF